MGNDATVIIWVGVRNNEDCDIDEIKKRLPKALFDKEGDTPYYEGEIKRVKKEFGCIVEVISCSEEDVGLGIVIFSHDWDYGIVPFDIISIAKKIEEEIINLRQIFDSCNMNNEIGVWCQTDWG